MHRLFLPAIFVVFTASGFAGLIYESIWSHYLKLFLGHAAYAQTLVLAIFMGGMAAGSWLASRWSPRWRNLLLAYALVEALIGCASLAFHQAFVAATAFAFDQVIPGLGSPAAVQAFKWSLASALILPQSVLLGATFPLMTGAVLRARPERAGYVVAMLYFTNSLGAGVGVLASGFYFIDAVGLPGTLIAGAIINFAVAAVVMLLPAPPASDGAAPAASPPGAREPALARLLLLVAALTGLSSFVYEIGWIRMLALVLGSSTHSFELMLSAFILGIAFGGLWVRRRIDASREPVALLGIVQVAMGLAALATLPVYGSSFRFMQVALRALTPSENGYVAFNLLNHAISLAVMFPAAFCAGMTLPLITAALLRLGAGEPAVGRVYAANTAGAIAGVIVAVHVGMPVLGLKGLIIAGAAIDLALGIVLLGARRQAAGMRLALGAAALSVAAVVAAAQGVQLDARKMASGVFRLATLLQEGRDEVFFQEDGKTTTVSITGDREFRALRSNGKSDGAIRTDGGPPMIDEVTMTLLGTLPQVLAPQATRVANIGFGTGMTAHVLLASSRIASVDTIEIEPAVVRAAALFRPHNARALDDPRSRVHIEDAKTYFSARHERYDVIVSEPSNPWVSGVASLFTTEFYRDVRRYLRDGGLFIQWVQVYEMTPQLLATIFDALGDNFSDYELWMASGGDLIVVASHRGKVPRADASALDNPALRAELARFKIRNLDDLLLHRVGGARAIQPYFGTFGMQANSDFFPVLDLNAPAARFMRIQTSDVEQLLDAGIPVLELFDQPGAAPPNPARLTPGDRPWSHRAAFARQALALAAFMRTGEGIALRGIPGPAAAGAVLLRAALVDCRIDVAPALLVGPLYEFAAPANTHLPRVERDSLWKVVGDSRCSAARAEPIRRWLAWYRAVSERSPSGMARAAQAILENETELPREAYVAVLASRVAGLLLAGDDAGAVRAFRARLAGADVSPAQQVLFRYLLGQTGLRARQTVVGAQGDKN